MKEFTSYPDGRWTEADHQPSRNSWVWCRGNVGEVFPNVMTPLSSSLFLTAVARGQAAAAYGFGMASKQQMRDFVATEPNFTGVFGGYLYGNVSLARAVTSRTPGLSAEMIDEQMFGLHDAPAHQRAKGEFDVTAIMRTMRMMLAVMRRPDNADLIEDQRAIEAYAAALPDPSTATVTELITSAASIDPWADRMMRQLLTRSFMAGFGRAMLERLTAGVGDTDLVNRLTAGLGTIESAEPARDLWTLGRTVRASDTLTSSFDTGLDGLEQRLRTEATVGTDRYVAAFVSAFDAFRHRHRARGPDEWELASPTWHSDPALALAMIDRLRLAPADRDPIATAARLARERNQLAAATRRQLPAMKRSMFDKAMHAAAAYSSQREATKAAFMRATLPARSALAELARRSSFSHADFFLLRFDEIGTAMRTPSDFTGVLAGRRIRRDYLQARNPPFWFDGEMATPATWPLRREQRQPSARPRTLTGMAVCPGRATGPARIVTDPADPRGIEPGDILIAPLTDPAWTPLFLSAAGVVVDVGAQQSHAAIVARELGIPAVVSVSGASSTIPDGALVTVDGSTGQVVVHGPSAD